MTTGHNSNVKETRLVSLTEVETRDKAYGYSALAYDKVASSPVKGATHANVQRDRLMYGTDGRIPLRGSKESLSKPKPTRTLGNPPVGSNIPIGKRHLEFFHTGGMAGEPHPALNEREWREANSIKGLLLPTNAADICPKCGFVQCKCRKGALPHNPATCECTYHVALRKLAG